jgi:hypothetical protein
MTTKKTETDAEIVKKNGLESLTPEETAAALEVYRVTGDLTGIPQRGHRPWHSKAITKLLGGS